MCSAPNISSLISAWQIVSIVSLDSTHNCQFVRRCLTLSKINNVDDFTRFDVLLYVFIRSRIVPLEFVSMPIIVVRLFTDEDREKGGEQDEYKKGVIKEREKVKMERYREREKEEEQEEGK